MKNQFKNSFIRQMGREVAHDTYKTATSFGADLSSINEATFTTKLVSNTYWWIGIAGFIGLFFPFIMVIPFICGIVRMTGKNVIGHYRGTYSNYKYDNRCRGGRKYLGTSESWVKAKRPQEECTEDQLKDAKMGGVIEMAISLTVFCLGMLIQF